MESRTGSRLGMGDSSGAVGEKSQHLYKTLVIGDYAVGKTSIIKRYCEGYFTPNYKLTIGVDFAIKVVDWDEDTRISLQLWDVAGHERFGTMTRVYYKYAIAAIIVFDLSRPATFDAVTKWRDDINSKVMLPTGQPIPILLLANKCDMEGVEPDVKRLDDFCAEEGFIGWFPTSAKDNVNIDEAAKLLISKILEVAATTPIPGPEEALRLDAPVEVDPVRGQKKECCSD